MKQKAAHNLVATALLAMCLSAGTAVAQDGDDPETTIRLMGVAEATLPDVVMNEITLPDSAKPNAAAVDKLEAALAHAGPGNLPEQSNAEEALERAKATVQEAHDNREDRGRGNDMPGRPDDLPGGPPEDRPGPPETPPGGPGN
jgi:hypothetical protein